MTTQIERPVVEITLPSGIKASIYSYITGGEMRKINAIYMEHMRASDVYEKKDNINSILKDVPVGVLLKAQELALSFLIVSVNGSTKEEAYKIAMEQLREDDLEFLINKVDEYTSGEKDEKKNEESVSDTTEVK